MKIKFLFLIFLVLVAGIVYAQEPSQKDILETANAGYLQYLEKIPEGQELLYGFKNRDEFAKAKIGKPFQIFLLTNEFFTDAILSNDNYLAPTNEWRVSVTVDNEFRVLITVAKMNGVWKVVGIGAAGLASELGTFEKKNPLINQNEMILRVLQLDCEFLFIPSDQEIKSFNAYFLKSATIVFDQPNDYQSSYPLNQVLTSIKNKFGNK